MVELSFQFFVVGGVVQLSVSFSEVLLSVHDDYFGAFVSRLDNVGVAF